MNKFLATLLLSIITLTAFSPKERAAKPVQDFSLMNVDGKMVSLAQYKDAKGFILVFTCNHCPFAKMYPERMNALSKKYSAYF